LPHPPPPSSRLSSLVSGIMEPPDRLCFIRAFRGTAITAAHVQSRHSRYELELPADQGARAIVPSRHTDCQDAEHPRSGPDRPVGAISADGGPAPTGGPGGPGSGFPAPQTRRTCCVEVGSRAAANRSPVPVTRGFGAMGCTGRGAMTEPAKGQRGGQSVCSQAIPSLSASRWEA